MSSRFRTWLNGLPIDGLGAAALGEMLASVLLVAQAGMNLGAAALVPLPGAILLGAMSHSARYLVRGRALVAGRRRNTGVSLAAGALVTGATFTAFVSIAWSLVESPRFGQIPSWLFAWAAASYATSALYHASREAEQAASEAQRDVLSASLRAREAELTALSAKVNPHFLFNSLTSIAALTTRDPSGARRMALDLAALLRDRLGDVDQFVPLAEELTTVRLYLGIEGIRFAERLVVEERIEPSATNFRVPKLILQPLVENAVKHGIAGSAEGGVIRLSAQAVAGGLRLRVESPISERRPKRPSASGFGQKLVQGRLEALYAGRASAEFSAHEGSWISTLFLPDEVPEQ